jgi:DNA-binding XRE family transcriptional regulator
MTFAENLKDLRTKARLSQSQLASQTCIPVKTIQAWEINRRAPRWTACWCTWPVGSVCRWRSWPWPPTARLTNDGPLAGERGEVNGEDRADL